MATRPNEERQQLFTKASLQGLLTKWMGQAFNAGSAPGSIGGLPSGLSDGSGAATAAPTSVVYKINTNAAQSLVGSSSRVAMTDATSHTSTAASITAASESPLPDKIVVMGQMRDEDTLWVAEKLPDWQHAVYIVDDPSATRHTAANKGKEANAYLTYLVDNYDSLPATVAFLHSHEKGWPRAWHTDAVDYSNVRALRALNVDFVQRNGYANLRCIATPGCPDEVLPFREPADEGRVVETNYARVWQAVFNNTDVPRAVGAACCAQFAVSREQVRKRPREQYVTLHRYLMETELDDETIGRVYEYMWHIIFGQEAV
ncbi:hypothetical protein MBLNU459_g3670t1 [Dothideomycetes sp. NU459]